MAAFTVDLWAAVGWDGREPRAVAVLHRGGARDDRERRAWRDRAGDDADVLHVESLATYNAGMAALTQELAGLAGPVEVDGKQSEIDLVTGQPAVRGRVDPLAARVPDRAGQGVRRRDADRGLRRARRRPAALVNDWTAQQTHDRIPEILPRGSVDAATRLVLVNALYFKAPWDSPFEKAADVAGSVPPRRRHDGPGRADVRRRRARRTSPVSTSAGPACPTPAARSR